MEIIENKINELKEKEGSDTNISYSNEEALNIQIDYLKSSVKNILFSLIINEQDSFNNENRKLDKGIYMYLMNIYNKFLCNEIKYILGAINNKISFINAI